MNFTAPSPVRRAESEVSALLSACVDYRKLLIRLAIPDPVTGGIEALYDKYGVELEPRSLYGEAPRGKIYDRDRSA